AVGLIADDNDAVPSAFAMDSGGVLPNNAREEIREIAAVDVEIDAVVGRIPRRAEDDLTTKHRTGIDGVRLIGADIDGCADVEIERALLISSLRGGEHDLTALAVGIGGYAMGVEDSRGTDVQILPGPNIDDTRRRARGIDRARDIDAASVGGDRHVA